MEKKMNNKKLLDLLPESIKVEGSFSNHIIRIDGRRLDIRPSQRAWHKSENFSWGYGGSGPSQLALAMLMEYWKEEDAKKWFQDFKFNWVGALPQTDFVKTINLREIMENIFQSKSVQ